EFVTHLGTYAKGINSGFIIIPQNGQELITYSGEGNGTPYTDYLAAMDATGRESMFYGYYNDDEATPAEDKAHLLELCLLCEQYGVEVLATDYCFTHSKMDDSYSQNQGNGFISFAADQRELNSIPDYPAEPYNMNSNDITDISQAQNFLYLINGENYTTKQELINAVSATNYDVIIMDLCFNEEMFTDLELLQLKTKGSGGDRLVICYMSIGEAENYRFYWQSDWNNNKPEWLDAENPDWAGNYKVRYWYPEWQAIIFGSSNSYLDIILDAGFDGVYLDIVDAFEYFEEL
ncbi:MAG: endo alpha-1,4 polygalactosaminidase, partial [Candidatus Sabulitectum sp.]|nr:endo alpha-1,4 polygalactosaminidase [Candidatus Sabulitectum sp.]